VVAGTSHVSFSLAVGQGLAFSRAGGRLRRVDLTDAAAVEALLRELRPAVVVHAAAERRPDAVESGDAAARLNVAATATLARVAAELGAWLLYISTDYVFDGTSPPYGEDAAPRPLQRYGETKLAGEREVAAAHARALSLRLPILFGALLSRVHSVTVSVSRTVSLCGTLLQSCVWHAGRLVCALAAAAASARSYPLL
jgi:dTDP-4-dehydrorhamnose reductase